ncbi:iron-containing redox enzyme family protein [Kitasatospora sp. NPDC085895]|uniref:iron-containing redox enzyme family protein n=1 Tax=Kitasatospora sp. NPDC085895 TaxID=3155057 RepID=UPI00344E1ADB
MTSAPPSRSTALRLTLDLAALPLQAATSTLWRPDGLGGRYTAYLRAMHAVVRASVPLMELAARRCAAAGPGDRVAGPLGAYLERHVEEERGHDDWLLEDLAAAGAAPDAGPPPVAAARLVGPQYYWIEHVHPVALLGYMTVLEGHAPAPWLAGRLAARTGLPRAAFRTVHDHAVLDAGHRADLDALLDGLPLDVRQESAVTVSALHTVTATTHLFRSLAHPGPSSGDRA